MKKLVQPYLVIILISFMASTATSVGIYARPGCKDMCGNIQIPYPFGIGPGCSINKWYAVDCNSSIPYLPALNNLQVLSVGLDYQAVIVNVSKMSNCESPNRSQILNVDLDGSPFLLSADANIFVVEGCGAAFILGQGTQMIGCRTKCENYTSSRNQRKINESCNWIDCCVSTIPYDLKSYNVDVTSLESQQGGSVCGSAYLVDQKYFFNSTYRYDVINNNSFLPITLLWTLTSEEIPKTGGCDSQFGSILNLGNGTTRITYSCHGCPTAFEEGNPYLSDGCQVVEECATCRATGKGDCYYQGVNYSSITCVPYYFSSDNRDGTKSSTLGIILGVSISTGVLLLMATIFSLYKVIRKTTDRRRRKRFFKRNGGLLLKQQESRNEGLIDKTMLFTAKELEKATDYFNENRILGRGGQGTVYKGMLTDGRIVAVKRSKIVDESQLEQFINEVVVLSQVNHRNVVKLLGCCLETEVPLLVSEFISNGTLYDCIHGESDEFPLTLNRRLQIATEIAGALAYLHSATSIPIYHRDIKSTNILLDDKFRAKVADFGTSRFVSIDQTHLTTLVKGTFGYLDPEYFQSSQFTEKSDVYSFGVVLVELLTSEKPISLTRFGEHRSLATHFMVAMEEGQVMSVVDSRLVKEGSREELLAVSNIAMQCLNLNGKIRPSMKEVASELESIRMAHVPSTT